MDIKLFFSDYFEIDNSIIDEYGALDICIDADLPVFIDPFLLFSSDKPEYIQLHDQIVGHLINLKKIVSITSQPDINLFKFSEIHQNWLGLCKWGNKGRGLGPKFARNLVQAFNGFYSNFGNETISYSSHIEKLTLVGSGIGRDFISDFTTNIMLEFLLEYTQAFALEHLREDQRKKFSIRCKFDKTLMIWIPRTFILPYFYIEDGDYILLTPLDILTKDDAFISHNDLTHQFRKITSALENSSLRDAINTYFRKRLPRVPNAKSTEAAINATIQQYPVILDNVTQLLLSLSLPHQALLKRTY